jgi:hypothetical protein
MTTIVTRAGKGSPLTNNEVDANFTNLNTAKIETLTSTDTSVTITGTGSTRDLSVPVNPNVVSGPASATDNAIARFDSTTGKLIQNSVVIVGDTGSITGVNALTAESLVINNNATLGSSNSDTLDVNARITTDLEPNANNAKDIGTSGRNWRDGFFGRTLSTVNIEVTGTTSFDGAQGTSGQVLTSAGTGNTPTWTTPTTGTVTSVTATAGTGISITGSPITTSGTLNITNTAPDQTVAISSGTGISVTGTYPNFTVASTVTGASITDDTTTNATYYPLFSSGTSGTLSAVNTSSTKYTYNPSTGTLSATVMTASSDERFKTNWRDVSVNFVSQLAKLKSGVFDRTDFETTEVGVSAQSLQAFLAEAVVSDKDGFLSVNYGGAALVAAVELAKVVEELRAEIAVLKQR